MSKNINAGRGYRLLQGNEILRAGDEFYYLGTWDTTIEAGHTVARARGIHYGVPYRRKIKTRKSNVKKH